MQEGKLHIYYGDGKGKTTAAAGLCVRAAGQGLRVILTQFLKDGTSGELSPLEQLGVSVLYGAPVQGFLWEMAKEEKAAVAREHMNRLNEAFELSQSADLLVLDEVLPAVTMGLMEEEALLRLLQSRAARLEVVLTGHKPTDKLLALADYATQFQAVKHPYQYGLAARKGIEF